MPNIKTLSRYLYPMIFSPAISRPFSYLLFFVSKNSLVGYGSSALAAYSVVNEIIPLFTFFPSLLPMLGCLMVASSAEIGKNKEAIQKHSLFIILFAATILLGHLVLFIMHNALLELYSTSLEIIAMAGVYLSTYAVTVIVATIVLLIIGQVALKKYSPQLTFIIGGGCLLAGYIVQYVVGYNPAVIGITLGLRFAGSIVAPFALIPVKAYSASFGKGESTKAVETLTPIEDTPKSYLDQYRENHK